MTLVSVKRFYFHFLTKLFTCVIRYGAPLSTLGDSLVINGNLKVVLKYCCRLCGDELKRKVIELDLKSSKWQSPSLVRE